MCPATSASGGSSPAVARSYRARSASPVSLGVPGVALGSAVVDLAVVGSAAVGLAVVGSAVVGPRVGSVRAASSPDAAMLSVALRELRNLV